MEKKSFRAITSLIFRALTLAMGVAVVGGMVVSTFFTMFIVPAIYSYISTERKHESES